MTQKDVLTFGETMLRFSPPGRQRLEQAAALEAWVAGSESNVAAALRVLGVSATWVSRLPDNPMGRRVVAALRERDVDVSHVIWTPPEDRVGVFYAEAAAAPRAPAVVYDRAGSAASFLSSADLPDDLFDTHRHLHVSGITPALSGACAETVADAIRRARSRGRTVSLDVNYRAKLWSPEAAAVALAPLLDQVDILLCGRDDAARVFGLAGSDEERAGALRARFGARVVALTTGGDGAVGCDAEGCRDVPAVPLEATTERLGSGDAFAAGFLAASLAGESLEHALRLGVATATLKRTIPGDMLIATRADVEAIMTHEAGAWR